MIREVGFCLFSFLLVGEEEKKEESEGKGGGGEGGERFGKGFE